MKKELTVGLVVADDTEYMPICRLQNCNLQEQPYFGRMGHTFSLHNGDRTVMIHSVYCGIGKVNAATAAAHLVENGCEVLLNYGLSGGVSGVAKGDFVLGTSFVEHDFDLTCLGYQPCQKPDQPIFCKADPALNQAFMQCAPDLFSGIMACGDCFVSNDKLRDYLRDSLQVTCCDMETAAIASVAALYGVPFATLRQVSDDAGESAACDYRSQTVYEQVSLFEKFMSLTTALFAVDKLWR